MHEVMAQPRPRWITLFLAGSLTLTGTATCSSNREKKPEISTNVVCTGVEIRETQTDRQYEANVQWAQVNNEPAVNAMQFAYNDGKTIHRFPLSAITGQAQRLELTPSVIGGESCLEADIFDKNGNVASCPRIDLIVH